MYVAKEPWMESQSKRTTDKQHRFEIFERWKIFYGRRVVYIYGNRVLYIRQKSPMYTAKKPCADLRFLKDGRNLW